MSEMEYTVVLDGDGYDHEAFLEMVADFEGANVTEQTNPNEKNQN